MATKEQVEYVFKNLMIVNPEEFFKGMNNVRVGVGAVIKILSESATPISAGEISEKMCVSTARTAVLLKKMLAKQLIVKLSDKNDKRKTLVALSDYGKQTAQQMKDNLYRQLSKVIDILGMEKIEQFIESSKEIRNVVLEHMPKPPKFDE